MHEHDWTTTHRRQILCVGLGIIAAWYGILLGFYLVIPMLKNAIRARVLDTLRTEFASDARFQDFDVSFWPRPHMTAHGVTIGNNAAYPIIQASTAEAEAESYLLPWHIRILVLQGLSLQIPTVGSPDNARRTSPITPPNIAEIVSEHAHLEILRSDGQQAPLHFELTHLRATNFDPSRGADFSALIETSVPRAEIQATGHLGPWNTFDPGATPVQGMYASPLCRLTSGPGFKGTFSSQGRFQGALQRIEIAGDANVPEFSLNAKRPVEPLRATFHAALDAWNGSASIEQLRGSSRSSSFVASGFVRNIQDDRRRDIALRLSVISGKRKISSLSQ